MRKIIYLLLFCLFIPTMSFGQGKITRHTHHSTTSNHKTSRNVTISEPDGYINGHGYVDLGLPSGTKWATCNLGAIKFYDYGEYYVWGEIMPKSIYTKDNCLNGDKNLGNIAGNPRYDAATYNWGSNWQIPSIEHFNEIKSLCKWAVITYKGIEGHKVTGPNGKSLFLPCGGCKQDNEQPYLREGNFLTSNHDGYGPKWFYFLGSGASLQRWGDIGYYVGRNIRAIVR